MKPRQQGLMRGDADRCMALFFVSDDAPDTFMQLYTRVVCTLCDVLS